jgi:hypothetical protein
MPVNRGQAQGEPVARGTEKGIGLVSEQVALILERRQDEGQNRRSELVPVVEKPLTQRRLTSITDGLSNTLMIAEMAGRPWPFLAHGKKLTCTSDPDYPAYLSASPGTDTAGNIVAFTNGNGAWAHNNNFNVGTWSADGKVQNTGACAVNCSNFRGVYSFHDVGAFAGLADGSVRLVGADISEQTFMALLTAQGGERINDQ